MSKGAVIEFSTRISGKGDSRRISISCQGSKFEMPAAQLAHLTSGRPQFDGLDECDLLLIMVATCGSKLRGSLNPYLATWYEELRDEVEHPTVAKGIITAGGKKNEFTWVIGPIDEVEFALRP